ncbi:MAG: DUF1080 domain-containing protein [Verrucomicrobiales bacterium]|nr:DUF1080 domain-containing protein [Verrucomicrobiales bacterium]
MKKLVSLFSIFVLAATSGMAGEWKTLFDGKSLDGWEGHDKFWSVKDGTIHGQTTAENPTKGNTFLILKGEEVTDFEFVCQVKFGGNNSGVMYRSEVVDQDNFVMKGYQADLHPKHEYFGMLYGEKYGKRGIIAQRGQRVVAKADGSKEVVNVIGDDTKLTDTEWNELRIVAVGNRLLHFVNGQIAMDLTDNHPDAMAKGKIGLQLHGGPPMFVNFKDLKLRHLEGDEAKKVLAEAVAISDKTAKPAAKAAPKGKGKGKGKGKSADAGSGSGSKKNDPNWVKSGEKPKWIWNDGRTEQRLWFRHGFEIPADVKSAKVYTTCDNGATVYLNGKRIGENPDWQFPIHRDGIEKSLKKGGNTIAVAASNKGGVAAFILRIDLETTNGKKLTVTTQPAGWKATKTKPADGWEGAGFDESAWNVKLKSLGEIGTGPWGIPSGSGGAGGGSKPSGGAPAADQITAADGFKVDLLYTVPRDEQGSWVSLTKDPKGRFYASDQGGKGLYRITVSGAKTDVEKIDVDGLSGAQGLEWAFGGLYFHKNGGHLHKLTDTNDDDILDKVEVLPSDTGGGEHGNHAVILTEDEKALYVIGGNHAALPPEDSIARNRIQSWDEDLLLPRQWDARGHARGRLAPGGWVTRFDPEKKTHELVSIGYRNQYDIALNSRGDLFTYDADMEWDLGMPWYRPTRINLVVSGSDYGWRSGSGKWPSYYEDSLPPVVDIGPGCPTGVVTGVGTRFPIRYQDAIFALDWTFGTIYAIHLEVDGAGYTGKAEPWVYGSPLPVTDAEIGDDGNFYFLIGGRNTQSAMYRVSYIGNESTDSAGENAEPEPRKLRIPRATRLALETYHGIDHPHAITNCWHNLSNEDRWIRNAARVAIESQPVERWAEKVITETNPQAKITGAVALARMGNPEKHRAGLTEALLGLDPSSLTDDQKLGLLRAYALTFTRLGKPTRKERLQIIDRLDPLLPSENADVNTELIRVLVYLEAPNVVPKAMKLITDRGETEVPDWTELASRNSRYGGTILKLLENHPPSREINYAFLLRNMRRGWTVDLRREYFEFLNEAAKYAGGASYPGFLANIRAEALGNCNDAERAAVADITGEDFNPKPDFEIQPPKGPGRQWTVAEANAEVGKRQRGRSFENGRNLFHATACGACHRFAGLGGAIGPDLTSVKNKFDRNYLIESIIDPSAVISDQYSSSTVTLKDGKTHTGLVIEEGEQIKVYPPDHTSEPAVVKATDVEKVEPVPVSQMPPALINTLNPDELADLVAYIMSGGNKDDKVFK